MLTASTRCRQRGRREHAWCACCHSVAYLRFFIFPPSVCTFAPAQHLLQVRQSASGAAQPPAAGTQQPLAARAQPLQNTREAQQQPVAVALDLRAVPFQCMSSTVQLHCCSAGAARLRAPDTMNHSVPAKGFRRASVSCADSLHTNFPPRSRDSPYRLVITHLISRHQAPRS